MLKYLMLLVLLPIVAQAAPGDCLKLAAFKNVQDITLQTEYLRQVQASQWVAYLKASDKVIAERYEQNKAKCKLRDDVNVL